MSLPLYNASSGLPYYDSATGLPVYGGGVPVGVFGYRVQRATWSWRADRDGVTVDGTTYESLFDVMDLLVSNYGDRSWWTSEWFRTENPASPLGISHPSDAYDIALASPRTAELTGWVPGGGVQPGECFQKYIQNVDFSAEVGGWILSGNSVTLSGTGYSGGLSAFGTDLSGAIVDAAGIPISATGTAVDVSSISDGGTFYVLPTNPIISAFEEIDGYVVFDYSKTLVDCSGLTVTAAP